MKRYSAIWLALGIALILGGVGSTLGPAQTTSSASELTSLEGLMVALYEQVAPSVVGVISQTVPYSRRFSPEPREGIGSGFVYDTAGHVVTNYHVVAEADSLEVVLADETTVPARVVGTDEATDLAVLQIQGQGPIASLTPLPLGESATLRPGQLVVALGNPFGLDRTMTLGIISAARRTLETPSNQLLLRAIQTDAAINPGNSGGPLLDLQGRVIGVATMIVTPSGNFSGVGFAIPVETVKRVVPELIRTGRYPHPWLGIKVLTLTRDLAQRLEAASVRLGVEQGVLIIAVEPGSPASRAGLQGGTREILVGKEIIVVGGDVITAIDGTPVESVEDLIEYLETQTQVGQTVTLTIVRQGQTLQVQATLGEAP